MAFRIVSFIVPLFVFTALCQKMINHMAIHEKADPLTNTIIASVKNPKTEKAKNEEQHN